MTDQHSTAFRKVFSKSSTSLANQRCVRCPTNHLPKITQQQCRWCLASPYVEIRNPTRVSNKIKAQRSKKRTIRPVEAKRIFREFQGCLHRCKHSRGCDRSEQERLSSPCVQRRIFFAQLWSTTVTSLRFSQECTHSAAWATALNRPPCMALARDMRAVRLQMERYT